MAFYRSLFSWASFNGAKCFCWESLALQFGLSAFFSFLNHSKGKPSPLCSLREVGLFLWALLCGCFVNAYQRLKRLCWCKF